MQSYRSQRFSSALVARKVFFKEKIKIKINFFFFFFFFLFVWEGLVLVVVLIDSFTIVEYWFGFCDVLILFFFFFPTFLIRMIAGLFLMFSPPFLDKA